MTFESLGLRDTVLQGITAAGYEKPTEIQEKAIPPALDGKHLIALGQTGSGKTAAFGLPILDRLQDGEPGLRAVILVPTRELCVQVAENLRNYATFTGLHVRTAFGGIPITVQEQAFRRGLDVLVACPGRLIDHLQCKNITLDRVSDLVLDEADRMLDMGFMPQIRRIMAYLPRERRNGLFSATMPPEIEKLVEDHFQGAVKIQVGARSQAASTITHRFENVAPAQKERELVRVLESRGDTVIVFVKTKKRAEELGRKLQRARLPADSLHGDKGAEQRHVVLKGFMSKRLRFLVATDVAARGIDISDVGMVVNFDMPHALEDYIHRVGRTGRAGQEGEGLTFVSRSDRGLFNDILGHLKKTSKGMARVVVDGDEILTPEIKAERKAEREESRENGERKRSSRKESFGDDETEKRSRSRGRRTERSDVPDEMPSKPRRERRASKAEVTLAGAAVGGSDQGSGFGAGVDESDATPSEDRKPRRRRRRD